MDVALAMAVPRERNLGYFDGFMRAYGRADLPTRAALYQDVNAYRYGREPAAQLYGQVTGLLGLTTPPPGYTGP